VVRVEKKILENKNALLNAGDSTVIFRMLNDFGEHEAEKECTSQDERVEMNSFGPHRKPDESGGDQSNHKGDRGFHKQEERVSQSQYTRRRFNASY